MSRDRSTPPTIEQRARRRVALKSSFYVHALVFVLVNGAIYLFWQLSGWGDGWGHHRTALPLWGWALGLSIHGIVVFVRLHGEGLRERWVNQEIEALRRRDGDGGARGDQPPGPS